MTQFCFPMSYTLSRPGRPDQYVCWTRTYPGSLRLDRDGTPDPTDHLAVASGLVDRFAADPTKVSLSPKGTLVEDLSEVPFADVDVVYLDYLLSAGSAEVRKAIAAYARSPEGDFRFGSTIVYPQGRLDVGWMYATLGTYHWYRTRAAYGDSDADSAFWESDSADDGWTQGRTWNSPDPDWAPANHQLCKLMALIQARDLALRYENRKAYIGEATDRVGGGQKYRAALQISRVRSSRKLVGFRNTPTITYDTVPTAKEVIEIRPVTLRIRHDDDRVAAEVEVKVLYPVRRQDGTIQVPRLGGIPTPVFETVTDEATLDLPGRWLVQGKVPLVIDTGHDQQTIMLDLPQFTDRFAWDAALWATLELRELLTRLTEKGPELVPSSAEETGPAAWISEKLEEIFSFLPSRYQAAQDPPLRQLCRMACQFRDAIWAEAARQFAPPEPKPVDPEDPRQLPQLNAFYRRMLAGLRRENRRQKKAALPPVAVIREQKEHVIPDSGEPIALDYACCYRASR